MNNKPMFVLDPFNKTHQKLINAIAEIRVEEDLARWNKARKQSAKQILNKPIGEMLCQK